MLSCKEVSRLVSESLDRKLSLWQRMQLWMHLMMCGMCSRFRKQTLLLHAAAKRYLGIVEELESDSRDQLGTDARERIKQSLRAGGQ
jgi:hypothetical protein